MLLELQNQAILFKNLTTTLVQLVVRTLNKFLAHSLVSVQTVLLGINVPGRDIWRLVALVELLLKTLLLVTGELIINSFLHLHKQTQCSFKFYLQESHSLKSSLTLYQTTVTTKITMLLLVVNSLTTAIYLEMFLTQTYY